MNKKETYLSLQLQKTAGALQLSLQSMLAQWNRILIVNFLQSISERRLEVVQQRRKRHHQAYTGLESIAEPDQ